MLWLAGLTLTATQVWRVEFWAQHLAPRRGRVAAADLITLVDHEWTGRAAEAAEIIRRDNRPLTWPVHPCKSGRKPGSWLLEAAEVPTFDR